MKKQYLITIAILLLIVFTSQTLAQTTIYDEWTGDYMDHEYFFTTTNYFPSYFDIEVCIRKYVMSDNSSEGIYLQEYCYTDPDEPAYALPGISLVLEAPHGYIENVRVDVFAPSYAKIIVRGTNPGTGSTSAVSWFMDIYDSSNRMYATGTISDIVEEYEDYKEHEFVSNDYFYNIDSAVICRGNSWLFNQYPEKEDLNFRHCTPFISPYSGAYRTQSIVDGLTLEVDTAPMTQWDPDIFAYIGQFSEKNAWFDLVLRGVNSETGQYEDIPFTWKLYSQPYVKQQIPDVSLFDCLESQSMDLNNYFGNYSHLFINYQRDGGGSYQFTYYPVEDMGINVPGFRIEGSKYPDFPILTFKDFGSSVSGTITITAFNVKDTPSETASQSFRIEIKDSSAVEWVAVNSDGSSFVSTNGWDWYNVFDAVLTTRTFLIPYTGSSADFMIYEPYLNKWFLVNNKDVLVSDNGVCWSVAKSFATELNALRSTARLFSVASDGNGQLLVSGGHNWPNSENTQNKFFMAHSQGGNTWSTISYEQFDLKSSITGSSYIDLGINFMSSQVGHSGTFWYSILNRRPDFVTSNSFSNWRDHTNVGSSGWPVQILYGDGLWIYQELTTSSTVGANIGCSPDNLNWASSNSNICAMVAISGTYQMLHPGSSYGEGIFLIPGYDSPSIHSYYNYPIVARIHHPTYPEELTIKDFTQKFVVEGINYPAERYLTVDMVNLSSFQSRGGATSTGYGDGYFVIGTAGHELDEIRNYSSRILVSSDKGQTWEQRVLGSNQYSVVGIKYKAKIGDSKLTSSYLLTKKKEIAPIQISNDVPYIEINLNDYFNKLNKAYLFKGDFFYRNGFIGDWAYLNVANIVYEFNSITNNIQTIDGINFDLSNYPVLKILITPESPLGQKTFTVRGQGTQSTTNYKDATFTLTINSAEIEEIYSKKNINDISLDIGTETYFLNLNEFFGNYVRFEILMDGETFDFNSSSNVGYAQPSLGVVLVDYPVVEFQLFGDVFSKNISVKAYDSSNDFVQSNFSLIVTDQTIYGCMDELAFNYDSEATVDDGSCIYLLEGCMDPLALNYDPAVQVDDGTCFYAVQGCTDPVALNYNASAQVDDGSCLYTVQPPVVSETALLPTTAYATSTFTCYWIYSDINSYVETNTKIRWYVNELLVETDFYSAGQAQPTLVGKFGRDDTVKCVVEGSNGFSLSQPQTSNEVMVLNTAPAMTSATVQPLNADKKSVLVCNPVNPSDVDGDSLVSYTKWYSAGAGMIRDWALGSSLLCEFNSGCFRGEEIWCETKLFDGTNNSSIRASSNTVILQNTPPRALNVIISPFNRNPVYTEDLNCTYDFYDLDGDSESNVFFKWYNGGVLTAHESQILNATETTIGETWRCSVTVNDGYINGSETMSAFVFIEGEGPRILDIDLPSNIKRDQTRSVLWSWTHLNRTDIERTFTHYLCSSDIISVSGCEEGKTLCVFNSSATPEDCDVMFTDDLSPVLYLTIFDDLGEASITEPIIWGFELVVPTAQTKISVNASSSYNKFICEAINNPVVEDHTLFYVFKDKNGVVLQSESGINSFFVNAGQGTLTDPVTCDVRIRLNNTFSDYFSDDNHLLISSIGYSSERKLNEEMIVRTKVLNNETIVGGVTLTLRSPLNVIYTDLEMVYDSATDFWEYAFAPNVAGTWKVNRILAEEESGESYLFKGVENTHYFVVSAPRMDGGGSTIGDVIEVIQIPKSGNITGYCGDGICQEWEDPFNCWQDCKVNIDSLFVCIWDDDIECNWGQSWFAALILIFIVVVIVFSIGYYELKNKRW